MVAEYHHTNARAPTGDGILENTTTVIVLGLIVLIYLLPTLIAYSREHPWRAGIGVLNIVFGWTLIGWIVVFLWASLARTESQLA